MSNQTRRGFLAACGIGIVAMVLGPKAAAAADTAVLRYSVKVTGIEGVNRALRSLRQRFEAHCRRMMHGDKTQ